MKTSWRTLTALVSLYLSAAGGRISLGPDGRYRGVTVRISDDIADTNCPRILANLKVKISKIFLVKYTLLNIFIGILFLSKENKLQVHGPISSCQC